MRNVWILVASALLAFANFVKSQEAGTARNLYSSRYDNLDIDTILGSSRLVNNYVDCLLSRKPCPPEGKDLKRILPEALRTKCTRCSPTQKENALKIITTLYYSYPDQYMALRERWDPSGEYHRRFEEYLQGLQFNQIGSNGNGDRPVRNDFDRDQSQVLLQTLILSTTTVAPPPPPPQPQPSSPNALPSGPEQRPQQLAQPSAQLTQPVAPVSLTSTTSTTTTVSSTSTATTTTLPTTTTTSTTTEAATTTTRTTTTSTTPGTTSTAVPNTTTTGSSSSMANMAAAAVVATSQAPSTVTPTVNNPRPTVGALGNRFGDDGDQSTTAAPSPVTVRPTTRPVVRQTTSRILTPRPTPPRFGGGLGANNNNNNPNASPFVGLFNQIGNKLATTADAIAGMLRRTVDVLVTTHLQAHQQRRSVRSD